MGVPDELTKPLVKRQRLSLKSRHVPQDNSLSSAKEGLVSKSSTSASSESSSNGTSSTSTSTSDVCSSSCKEDCRVPAVASLENLGNTCFMNSVMQVLRYTPGFLHNLALLYQDIQASEKVMRKNKKDDKDQSNAEDSNIKGCWKVVKSIYKVYRDLTLLETKYDEVATDDVMSMAVKPNRVLLAVRDLNSMYAGNMQHDAQEFLKCLLCYLQEAEKDVQKFHSHIPQKLSPKTNPIMKLFLNSAKANPEFKVKIEKIVSEIGSNPSEINGFDKSGVGVNLDKVKTKLFSEPKINQDLLKCEKKVPNGTNAADMNNVVDNEKDKKDESISLKNVDCTNVKTEECQMDSSGCQQPEDAKVADSIGKQSSGKNARVVNRFKPYDKKIRGQTKEKRFEVSGQPSISDVFMRTYSKNKRLGMRGAIVKQSNDKFDNILSVCNKEKSSSPLKEVSRNLVSMSEMKESNKSDSCVEFNQANTDEGKSNNDLKKSDPVFKLTSSVSSELDKSAGVKSFQDAFSAYLNNVVTEESESEEPQSDSDSEDIVMKKMKEKQLNNSPRRSPRKVQSESFRSDKNKVSKLALGSKSEANVQSAQYKLKLDDEMIEESESENPSHNAASSNSSATLLNCVTEKDVDSVTEREKDSQNDGNKASAPVALDPIVMLENCDHVLNGDGAPVSAAYASKCLSPVKLERRGSSCSGVGNYLKERNIFNSIDESNEADVKKALIEMLNSPIKSRSKYDLIERTFQGTMMLRTRCTVCESSWERHEDFHDVSVPVRIDKADSDDEEEEETDAACGLLDLIQASTDIEKLQEDNKYKCDQCNVYVEAERSIHYDILPDILTLHLKRFCAEAENPSLITKINDHVNIPLSLPCLRYRCQQSCLRPDHRYILYGIVTHAGCSLTSGHYLTYARSLPDHATHEVPVEASNSGKPTNLGTSKTKLENDSGPSMKKDDSTLPTTRRKLGVQTKLPSRFNDSVIANTKVKTLQSLGGKKPTLMERLAPSQSYNGEWFECNDESIRVFDEDEFVELLNEKSGSLLGTPYLLFYHKATLC